MSVRQHSNDQVNITIVKKDKKFDKDLNQVKYYNCYKKSHYTNKCLHK